MRREFITLLGGAAAWPIAARPQQPERMRRVGFLSSIAESDPEAQSMVAALHQALQESGWADGRNLRIDRRWAAGNPGRIEAFAKELVGLQPEVIVGYSTPTVVALRKETGTISAGLHWASARRDGDARPEEGGSGIRSIHGRDGSHVRKSNWIKTPMPRLTQPDDVLSIGHRVRCVHLHVSEVELAALNAAAERRSLKLGGVVAKLVETVVRDNLLDALLDDE